MPRAKRICPVTSCPNPAEGRYCRTHNAEYEAKRGTREQRGYGSEHKKKRAAILQMVNAGRAICAKCNNPIRATEAWDLGHTDDRSAWTGAEHAYCNRADGGRRASR